VREGTGPFRWRSPIHAPQLIYCRRSSFRSARSTATGSSWRCCSQKPVSGPQPHGMSLVGTSTAAEVFHGNGGIAAMATILTQTPCLGDLLAREHPRRISAWSRIGLHGGARCLPRCLSAQPPQLGPRRLQVGPGIVTISLASAPMGLMTR
jgi:hypothetical protein